MFVGCVWVGGNVDISCFALAPHTPLPLAFQLEAACNEQRIFEWQEFLASARTLACHCARRLCLHSKGRERQQASRLRYGTYLLTSVYLRKLSRVWFCLVQCAQ